MRTDSAQPGCHKKCAGASECVIGWDDGSCGAAPKGSKWPDPNNGIKELRPKCDQHLDDESMCPNFADYICFWPSGRIVCCADHASGWKQVAEAMGFVLEMIPVSYALMVEEEASAL